MRARPGLVFAATLLGRYSTEGFSRTGSTPAGRVGSLMRALSDEPQDRESSGNVSFEARLGATSSRMLQRPPVNDDPDTTHTTIVIGASGAIGNAFYQAAVSGTDMPVVAVLSRPGEDQPGEVRNQGGSTRQSVGHLNANQGQSREVLLAAAFQQQMRLPKHLTVVLAAAPKMDVTGANRFEWFARPTMPVMLTSWIQVMQAKRPDQHLVIANVINPGTAFANMEAYLGDDRTVPFGGGAVDLSRTQDGVRPNEVACVLGPHAEAMVPFYVSSDASGELSVRLNRAVAGKGATILRNEGKWQTDPVGVAMQAEVQAYWEPLLSRSGDRIFDTLSIPLTRDDLAYIERQVNACVPVSERVELPEQLVMTAPRVFDPQTQQWELDRPIFDALLRQYPAEVVNALRATLHEYGQMMGLLRQVIETLRPEMADQWRDLGDDLVFGPDNRDEIRAIVNSLSLREVTQLRLGRQ